jgi:hypothetical protein
VDCSEGIDAASWNGLRSEKSKVVAEMLPFISAAGRLLACTRTGKAVDSVRTTVKSFVALSVRDRSSGNSPATIPHNSRQTTAVTRILPTCVRLCAIVKLAALYTSPETIVIGKSDRRPQPYAVGLGSENMGFVRNQSVPFAMLTAMYDGFLLREGTK